VVLVSSANFGLRLLKLLTIVSLFNSGTKLLVPPLFPIAALSFCLYFSSCWVLANVSIWDIWSLFKLFGFSNASSISISESGSKIPSSELIKLSICNAFIYKLSSTLKPVIFLFLLKYLLAKSSKIDFTSL